MIGDLIAVLFLSRDIAHREHLSTTSYSQHMALGEFYPGVIELADKLAEAYQGRHGLIGTIPLAENDFKEGGVVGVLSQHLMWVENHRYKAAPKADSTLQNIIDEVIALYLSTLYKLKHLK